MVTARDTDMEIDMVPADDINSITNQITNHAASQQVNSKW